MRRCTACARGAVRAEIQRQMLALVLRRSYGHGQGAGSSGNGAGCNLEWKLPCSVVCSVLGTACLIVFGAWAWRQRQGCFPGAVRGPPTGRCMALWSLEPHTL